MTWRRDGTIILAPAPIKDSLGAAGTQQHNRKPEKSKETTHDSSTPQPAVTRGNERATPSKKQQRDADRAEAHRALKASPPMARWKLLVQRQLWTARKATCNAAWTAWMRSRTPEARLEVRRKLRGLLWREWTRRQIEPPLLPPLPAGCKRLADGLQVLGARSLRDEYILARARALTNHPSMRSYRASGLSKALWSWLGFRRAMDFDRTYPAARSREAAGLIPPTSSRIRKKSRGGKMS